MVKTVAQVLGAGAAEDGNFFWYAFFFFVCKSLHLLLEYGSAAHPARVESELGLSHVFGVSTREFCQLPFRVELSKLTLWLRPGCNNGPTNWGSV